MSEDYSNLSEEQKAILAKQFNKAMPKIDTTKPDLKIKFKGTGGKMQEGSLSFEKMWKNTEFIKSKEKRFNI